MKELEAVLNNPINSEEEQRSGGGRKSSREKFFVRKIPFSTFMLSPPRSYCGPIKVILRRETRGASS